MDNFRLKSNAEEELLNHIKMLIENELTIYVRAHVRYWEDGEINGVDDDTENPNMPCVYGEYWCPVIDVEKGQIVNWVKGIDADIHYKVCDECEITLKQGRETIAHDMDYVPRFMSPKEEGYGDYIIMDVDDNGMIKNWSKDDVIEWLKELKS